MYKTKIETFDATWNPVTGCLHGCRYCYARGIAERFGGWTDGTGVTRRDGAAAGDPPSVAVLDEPLTVVRDGKGGRRETAPYPYGFSPTFHRYRLGEQSMKKGRNVFVGSMTDLFGKWVPDSVITEIFDVCVASPQHCWFFLSKNPGRYASLAAAGLLPAGDNMWYGHTRCLDVRCRESWFTADEKTWFGSVHETYNTFVSIEPLLGKISVPMTDWVIVGAETGNGRDRVVPRREWIAGIVEECREKGIPLFMKSNILGIWDGEPVREFPAGMRETKKVSPWTRGEAAWRRAGGRDSGAGTP